MAHSHSHGGHCSHDHGAPPPAAALAAPERPPRDMDAVLHPNDPLLSGGIAAGEGSSGAPGLADGSFKTSFLRAEALYHHIIDDTPACPDVTEAAGDAATVGGTQGVHDVAKHVEDAIRLFSACMKQLRYDGLISANETVKDMSTDTLQYLLIDFYLASLHQRAPAAPGPAGAAGRLAHLQAAVQCIQAFLFQCARTEAVPEAELVSGGVMPLLQALGYKGDYDDRASGSRSSGGGGAGGSSSRGGAGSATVGQVVSGLSWLPPLPRMDPTTDRAAKIARFKANAAAQKRLRELAEMNARSARVAKLTGGGLAAAEAEDGVSGAGSGAVAGGVDDDVRRETVMLTLAVSTRQCVDDLRSISQEAAVLAHVAQAAGASTGSSGGAADSSAAHAARAAADARLGAATRAKFAEAAAAGGHGLSPAQYIARGPAPDDPSVDPRRPGLEVTRIGPTMEVRRETVKAAVFQFDHIRPSVALEDWGDTVLGRMHEREAREKAQAAARPKTMKELQEAGIEFEDDPDAHDNAQARARAFDDWADGVPKGSGSTKRI